MFEGSGYIMSSNKSLTSKQRREQRREQRNAKRVKMLEEIQHIVDGFAYDISSRTVPLESAVIHAGPTNSGKTHHAIKAMIETYEKHGDSKGVIAYGGPLRLLAAETYTKLCEQLGEDNVGLITGDHEINPTAPVLACTVECLPERGHLVVIDEAHWAGDIDRGSAWTRALLGYHYEHMIVLSPIEMCDILTECVSDAATITVHHHERLVPLSDNIIVENSKTVKPQTIVVAFSKRAVTSLAGEIAKNTGLTVESLYGKMPLHSRENIVKRFADREIDVIVSTDVIGHGLNLPAKTILFAETVKFDGVSRRPLKTWEAAQIAGRAGRFGIQDEGHVGILKTNWGTVSRNVIQQAITAANGQNIMELTTTPLYIKPTLRHLGYPSDKDIHLLNRIVKEWVKRMQTMLHNNPLGSIVKVSQCSQVRQNLNVIVNPPIENIDIDKAWRLANAPLNNDSPVLVAARGLLSHNENNITILSKLWKSLRKQPLTAQRIEEVVSILVDMRTLITALHDDQDDFFGIASRKELLDFEQELSEKFLLLNDRNSYHACTTCGEPTAPWLSLCDSCYQSRMILWEDDDHWNSYHRYHITIEEREENNRIAREYQRAISEVSTKALEWFAVGDKVKVKHGAYHYEAVIVKKNKVTAKVVFTMPNGQEIEKNVKGVYLAMDSGYIDKLHSEPSYQKLKETVQPVHSNVVWL